MSQIILTSTLSKHLLTKQFLAHIELPQVPDLDGSVECCRKLICVALVPRDDICARALNLLLDTLDGSAHLGIPERQVVVLAC